MKPASTTLREFLARDEILVLPGVYDGISARVALGEGFDALYMTGMYGPFVLTFFIDLPALGSGILTRRRHVRLRTGPA
jgi:hypothetical protein